MEQRFTQEQILQRKMNQTLIQSIQLLQFTNVELIDYLSKIAEENPLIESIDYGEEVSFSSTRANDVIDDIGEMNEMTYSMNERLKQDLYMIDIEDHLLGTVLFGIDCINEDGYLDTTLEQWAEDSQVSLKQVNKALKAIQSLEPAGIGARSLAECIFLQLRHTRFNKEEIKTLLEDDLSLIAEENIEQMTTDYALNEDDALELIEMIKQCHPKPGQLIAPVRAEYIYPEAEVLTENGELKVSFYKRNQPTITIDETYESMLHAEKEVAQFLRKKYEQVNMLHRALKYRSSTLELVIQTMVHFQSDYFLRGPKHMKPLTLKQVAEKLDRHVSTISRTISNKYIQTNEGLLSLKSLLQSRVKNTFGEDVASFAVKQYILKLIQEEQREKPLSDQRLSEQLKRHFRIEVARRTVMKYRESLNIPSSFKRKQVKKT